MKKSVGFFMTILSAAAAAVGAAAYFMNCRTNYFINLGIDPVVMGSAVRAIVLQAAYSIVTQKGNQLWTDILAVLPPVLLIVATITLAGSRISGIASIMTFENNAQNMADLTSAIVGIAACLIATIVGIAASFFDTVKE